MGEDAPRPDGTSLEGALGAPSPPPEGGEGAARGFDPWLLALLLGVVALVVVQNVWLRRRAERESDEEEGGPSA